MIRHTIKPFVFLLTLTATAGCGLTNEPEHVRLYKCERSAMYLGKNENLMRKATSWRAEMLPSPESREEYMQRTAEYSEAMLEVMDGDGSLKRARLLDWYESDYCASVVSQYQDHVLVEENRREGEVIAEEGQIEIALARQIAHFSRSMSDPDSKEVRCEDFKEQVDITYLDGLAPEYRRGLLEGLVATIFDSSFKLKSYQEEFIASAISGGELLPLVEQVYGACVDGALLSDQIGLVDSVRYSESSRSALIREILTELDVDDACGQLPEVYCMADLRRKAARSALAVSKACDSSDNSGELCMEDAEILYLGQLQRIELERLIKEKKKYELYVADPSGSGLFNWANADSNIYTLVEECKHSAIERGLKGAEYQEHVANVCKPNARQEFVSPQASVLRKINLRVAQLRN